MGTRPKPRAEARRIAIPVATLLWCVAALSGCAAYELRGIVIEGREPGVEIVERDDPRLAQYGIASVALDVTLDPTQLSAKPIGAARSTSSGHFAIPISQAGAGFLLHEVALVAQRNGYRRTTGQFILPGTDKRVVVTLVPGEDKRERQRGNFLDQTLRDAQPYLRQ